MNQARRIIVASSTALAVAIAILVTSVLPAEYGWDPLGTGSAMGLMGLSETGQSPLKSQDVFWRKDDITFELAPFESVEYKYRIEEGAAMLFEWQSSGEVVFDMHSEPEGAAPGYAESFSQSRGTGDRGNYTAPFSGIHGWFWQNRGQETVTVHLVTAGFYGYAIEFRDGRENRYDF